MDRNAKNTRISRITNNQLSRLVTCLEAEPEIARNMVRGPQTAFWRKVASEMNDLGPARKDVTGWKRAWFDYKCSMKKRVKQHNAAIAEGTYPKHLSPIHRRVIKLLGYEVKKGKLTEEAGSGSEDTNHEDATQFDAEDQTDSNTDGALLHEDEAASDDNMHESPTRSSDRIRACQKRLEKLPNITVKMHRNDTDPLGNGTSSKSESVPAFGTSATKRAREANIRKALETNQALITAVNASLAQNKELIAEMRAVTSTCEELNENLKSVCGALRDLTEVLKTK